LLNLALVHLIIFGDYPLKVLLPACIGNVGVYAFDYFVEAFLEELLDFIFRGEVYCVGRDRLLVFLPFEVEGAVSSVGVRLGRRRMVERRRLWLGLKRRSKGILRYFEF
jgi:hypothetical protein